MKQTALTIGDFQVGTIDNYSAHGVIEPTNKAIDAAREADIPVVFVMCGFRAGWPEIDPSNVTFGGVIKRQARLLSDPTTDIHPDIHRHEDDVVVVKKRGSAFSGNDLEHVLRAGTIKEIVIAGVITSGHVIATLMDAIDRDLRVIVLSDACTDPDPETQRFFMEKYFPKSARVMTVREWIDSIG